METSANEDDSFRRYLGSGGWSMRRIGMQFLPSNFIQAPISALFDYLHDRSVDHEFEGGEVSQHFAEQMRSQVENLNGGTMDGEVAVRIVNGSEEEPVRDGSGLDELVSPGQQGDLTSDVFESRSHISDVEDAGLLSSGGNSDGSAADVSRGGNSSDTCNPRYDIQQQIARRTEQILPFSIL